MSTNVKDVLIILRKRRFFDHLCGSEVIQSIVVTSATKYEVAITVELK